MAHGIYFSANNDKEGFRLPINPEKVNVSVAGDGEKFSIAKTGKVNIPKDVELEEFSLQSYFPSDVSHYSVTVFREPQYYIDSLKRWQKNKMPVRYIYVDGSFTINELVTIEKFEYDETGGSADVNFTLSLLKFVTFSPQKMVVVKKVKASATSKGKQVVKKATPPRQNTKTQPKTYSLLKGDSLWKVAQKFLGNGARFREIAKLNGIKDSQFNSLPIGLKLKLPPK
jgi:nucleoid-associated protein YgaU